MKNVIIGTAGHVDHGKTALIRALTGIDTDRLEEEKRRGITIELGFAHIEFEDGTSAGIVDVPGHEKFIKNMLAGAGGIDLAMLIVAADEGVMPQTVEHLGILSLLGIKHGVTVLTKTDLVDAEWLELVTDDVRQLLAGTFLEDSPILPVSSRTGEGLSELRAALLEIIREIPDQNVHIPFRLPVDRVFPVNGFGTVVTGTLIEGVVATGDAAELMPDGTEITIRNIQVHGKKVDTAGAGQRVALNLSGVRLNDVRRGDVVARRGTLRKSNMVDVRLSVLTDSKRSIKNGSLLHMYHGSRELLAKAVLLDRDELKSGDSCYAQLRFTAELPSKAGDRFVVRFYSPLETIGGGVILDPCPPKRKRGDRAAIEAIAVRENGSLSQRVYQAVNGEHTGIGSGQPCYDDICRLLDVSDVRAELDGLLSSGRIVELSQDRYVSDVALDDAAEKAVKLLMAYHGANPLHAGMPSAELSQKLLGKANSSVGGALLSTLAHEGRLRLVGDRCAAPDFEIHFTKRQRAIREKLLKAYSDAGFETPFTADVLASFPPNEKQDCSQVMESLVSGGELIRLSPQLMWGREAYDRAISVVKAHFEENPQLTMPELRDMLGTSRKYALAFLDYLDGCRITRNSGDVRTLLRGF